MLLSYWNSRVLNDGEVHSEKNDYSGLSNRAKSCANL